MKNKLDIQWFIEQNVDWEHKLQEKPYCINISRDRVFGRNLILFKYNQIESDFNVKLVRECRGLILDEDTLEIVCFPFVKFGNYGESYCPEIDWNSCYVTEKLDGSLIKIVKLGNDMLVSTNGTIDAYKANLAEQIGCNAKSFGELVDAAIKNQYCHAYDFDNTEHYVYELSSYEWFRDLLEEGYTYMFELTSPFNKVVVQWHDTKLNFIGCRNNKTGQEIFFNDHPLSKVFNTPKVFPLRSVDECVKAAAVLEKDAEGYVVVDKNFNRVKIKSPLYVKLHHMANNHILTYERAINLIRENEVDEVLVYFPEFKEQIDMIRDKYEKLINSLETSWDGFMTIVTTAVPRKEAAIWIQKNFEIPGVGFALLDKKVSSAKEWIENCSSSQLVKWLNVDDAPEVNNQHESFY